MNTTSATHQMNNNESVTVGYVRCGGGFVALTWNQSKSFKTERGAIAWLATRGYDSDGTRLPE